MDRMTLIDSTLPKAVKADAILRALRREKREATSEEQALIDEVEACREIIIQVRLVFVSHYLILGSILYFVLRFRVFLLLSSCLVSFVLRVDFFHFLSYSVVRILFFIFMFYFSLSLIVALLAFVGLLFF